MIEPLRRDSRVWVSSLEEEPPMMAGNPEQIAARRCGASGKVTCVFAEEDTYFVRHTDGTVAPYKRAELTVESEETAPSSRSAFTVSCSDGPFPQTAPSAA